MSTEADLREKIRILESAKLWASAAKLKSRLEAVPVRFVTVKLLERRKRILVVDTLGEVWTVTLGPLQARTETGRRQVFADTRSLQQFMNDPGKCGA